MKLKAFFLACIALFTSLQYTMEQKESDTNIVVTFDSFMAANNNEKQPFLQSRSYSLITTDDDCCSTKNKQENNNDDLPIVLDYEFLAQQTKNNKLYIPASEADDFAIKELIKKFERNLQQTKQIPTSTIEFSIAIDGHTQDQDFLKANMKKNITPLKKLSVLLSQERLTPLLDQQSNKID